MTGRLEIPGDLNDIIPGFGVGWNAVVFVYGGFTGIVSGDGFGVIALVVIE